MPCVRTRHMRHSWPIYQARNAHHPPTMRSSTLRTTTRRQQKSFPTLKKCRSNPRVYSHRRSATLSLWIHSRSATGLPVNLLCPSRERVPSPAKRGPTRCPRRTPTRPRAQTPAHRPHRRPSRATRILPPTSRRTSEDAHVPRRHRPSIAVAMRARRHAAMAPLPSSRRCMKHSGN